MANPRPDGCKVLFHECAAELINPPNMNISAGL